jgi:hypothetical protein
MLNLGSNLRTGVQRCHARGTDVLNHEMVPDEYQDASHLRHKLLVLE